MRWREPGWLTRARETASSKSSFPTRARTKTSRRLLDPAGELMKRFIVGPIGRSTLLRESLGDRLTRTFLFVWSTLPSMQ